MITSFATKAYCLLLFTFFSFIARAQLTAGFSATPLTGCAPLLVSFSDQSTGAPTDWKWDLGNGTISYLQNPSVSYFNAGFYTIKLVVKNAANIDSVIKTQFIDVSAKPTVGFTAAATNGCYPLPVQFTDQSTAANDTLITWQWDFGDGFSSNQQNPLHVYTTSGNYNVTLRVINNKGCLNTLSKSQYIKINPGVEANFSNSSPNVCSAPVNIDFQNSSAGAGILTYEWLFGDGSGSALQNPSHIYNAPGTYTVKLIVTNASGCKDTLTRANAFTVGNVVPAFTTSDKVCTGAPLFISNTSNPIPSSAYWTFGDGTSSTRISPVKYYTAPGTYQIKLVANFGSCLDSAVTTVTVIPSPTAAFTSGDSVNCGFPFSVDFTNQALNATSYQWDFGDNTTSTSPNPAHTYNSYGNFKVQLVVTGINGCTDTLRKTNYVKIIQPHVVFNNLPDSGCVPFTKYFSTTTVSIKPVTGYLWDFGDGSTDTNATPTHTYTVQGIYTVKVIITTAGGCADTAVMTRAIITNSLPVAIFSATPRDACAKIPIKFTDQSTGNVSKWLWDFGDGTTSAVQNPQHIYFDTGYFDIRLIVWNSGCPDTVKYKDYIHINPPIARFIIGLDCSKPLERLFTNTSIGADQWHWDFGDGSTSTLLSPLHVYAVPGSYTVSLLVSNHTSGCDFTSLKLIRVVDVKATFFASDTVICRGSSISFSSSLDLSDVAIFNWDFGDGKTASSTTANTITHLYVTSGNYTVRLIITDILGCKDTLTKPTYIRIDGPISKFTSSVPGSCLNNLITFNDASVSDNVHPIQTWSWNYGDGTREILPGGPFQHNYTAPGAYIVTLKVTDSKGCTDSINIAAALIISKPVAKFTALDTVTCPSKQARFTNQSTGPGLIFLWNFGDGATSAVKDPVHNYLTDGTYSVMLFIRDQFGCTDSINKTSIISIITPVADFTMSDSFSTCPPLIVQFANFSLHSISQNWDFGDGTAAGIFNPSHFYSYPGIYTVTLTVTGKGGCKDVMKKNIVVNGPKGTFSYDPKMGCNPLKINFIASTLDRISFIWDYNDGTTVSTKDSVVSHTYTNPGIYLPKMILVDVNGCQVPITGKDTILVSGITAKFSLSDTLLCDRGNVSFINSSVSNDVITSYNWNLGDGSTSTLQSPQHQYTSTGMYYPNLIVHTLNGCVDSMRLAMPLKVVASPQVNMTSTSNGCTPLQVTFKGLIAVPDTSALSWNWTFGNGNTSALQNPVIQNYNVAGVFNAAAVVTNSSGCTDTANKAIEAYLIPTVSAGLDTIICNRIGTTLRASGAVNYNWGPSAGLSCTNCATPVATPDSARIYIVKGTSLQGCSAKDSVFVKVQYPFKMRFSKPDTLCKGQSVRLFASGTDRFQWSPATGLDNSNIALPVGNPDTTTTYRVIGTDNIGCFKDTGYVFVKVYPVPTVNAGADITINIGKSIDLVPVISPDVTIVSWSPTGSIFRNTYPAISIKPSQTTEYTVEARNRGGCMARDNVTVFVICNGANVFVPNTFSPNGDGANDVFYPRGTGLFKIKMLRIFNRWGEVVFERSGFNPNDAASGWDGTYKGVKLSADVFVYMIDIICDNNSVLTYKGNVALIQ
ncbi:MAG: PKD domain-containing protein [Ferruginibacter sp.]